MLLLGERWGLSPTSTRTHIRGILQGAALLHACSMCVWVCWTHGSALTSLQVEVYEDPFYGTPVFKTISGLSKCPHEAQTLARENFTIFTPQVSEGATRGPCKAKRGSVLR